MTAAVSKSEAQARIDRIQAFKAELDHLADNGILRLDPGQIAALGKYHGELLAHLKTNFDVDGSMRQKQLSWGMRIASFLGAVALAASVFFLFYRFWGYFSVTMQVAILVSAPILCLGATFLAALKEATGYYTKLCGLVCIACFVLNLVMLGRIFNITPSENAFLVWGVFALLLAYATDARLFLAAGMICLAGFIAARVGTWSGCYWIYVGQRPENFFPAALLLLLAPVVISHRRFSGFVPLYRVFGMLFCFLPILVLANRGRVSYLPFDSDIIEGFYQVMGFVLSALAIYWGLRKNLPDMVNTGNVLFVILLYTKFFDWWWDMLPKYLFFFLIGLTALFALVILKRLRMASASAGVKEGA